MEYELQNVVYNPPLEPYLTVIHRDDDILVLDKPSGLLSVPGTHPLLSDSLVTRVREQFPQAQMINRLDMDTSGIVLVSLNRKGHAFIATQFEQRTTAKLYNAVVWGYMDGDEGFVDFPLAIDPERKPRHRVDYVSGKPAQTQWRKVGVFSASATRLHLTPMTGRTHQLRVHMLSIGHPILGDEFYAQGEALVAAPRLLLHAERLGFRHPDGRDLVFTAPCPF